MTKATRTPLDCLKRLDDGGYLERILSLESGRPGYQRVLRMVTDCRESIREHSDTSPLEDALKRGVRRARAKYESKDAVLARERGEDHDSQAAE